MNKIIRHINIYRLTIKYWLSGDEWKFAKEYAGAIVDGFKSHKEGQCSK